MEYQNQMELSFSAISENESFARSVIACFALKLKPSVAQVSDLKTAVSEAVTNAIVHAYPEKVGTILMKAYIDGGCLHINIVDSGVGIDDVNLALEPFYTSKPDEERSGMGFTIMESFMTTFNVTSIPGKGTSVHMRRKLQRRK